MLTELYIRNLKPKEKPFMIRDDRGLYLEILASGRKYWRLRYWQEGKEKKRSLGTYPDVSLKDARLKRDEIKLMLAKGEDPFKPRAVGNSFEEVGREWFEHKILPVRAPGHARTVLSRLQRLVFPYIGSKSIQDIKAVELLEMLRGIEDRGHHETAHRVLQICGQIFRYAIATSRAERDISGDLRGALIPVKTMHYPTITDPKAIGALMRAINNVNGNIIIKCALKLEALTFVRPGELRRAEWEDFDLDKAEWRIPAEKMKMKQLHIVPLSRQALEVLREIYGCTGNGRFVFPSARTLDRPMSDAAVNAAIRRMGYSQQEFTGHSFRSMASTILNEKGWPPDVIERQLAHVERNSVRAAYNHAEYLKKRQAMMQTWADFLDECLTLF